MDDDNVTSILLANFGFAFVFFANLVADVAADSLAKILAVVASCAAADAADIRTAIFRQAYRVGLAVGLVGVGGDGAVAFRWDVCLDGLVGVALHLVGGLLAHCGMRDTAGESQDDEYFLHVVCFFCVKLVAGQASRPVPAIRRMDAEESREHMQRRRTTKNPNTKHYDMMNTVCFLLRVPTV